MNQIEIDTPKGKRKIGPCQPVFIVAEMSGNHNQDINRAYQIIDAAAAAGVDAIKLQTYTPDTITIDCDKEYFQVKVNDAWKGQTLYSLYQKAYTPWDWQPKLKKYAEKLGLVCFSTPFDETAVDFLEKIGVALYKVASFEVVNLELLKKIGNTKKPVIMSRGMASVREIEMAVNILKEAGAPQVAVLHCVSSYPAIPSEMNLSTIPDIAKKFQVVAGLSDHSLSFPVALTSMALGASIIEKHLTLRRADGGADAAFSLEPEELKELVRAVREAEQAIGQPSYEMGEKEGANIIFRPSIWVVQNIKKGEIFNEKNILIRRPGQGLAPRYYREIIGRKVVQDVERGEPLSWEMVEKKRMNPKLIELNNLILQQQLEKSDVIVWLQGDRFDRGSKVVGLFQQGWAPKILITGNNELAGPGKRPGENDAFLEEIRVWLAEQGVGGERVIFDNRAFNTRDQTLNTLQLAKREGWKKIIIVGSHPHYQFRAFLTFLKAADELSWFGRIINQPAIIAEDRIPNGREKTAKEILMKEAAKLEKYKTHVVSAEEGIRYLLLNKKELFFRKAVKEDAELLLQWRNDPLVRQFSFNQQIISKDEHLDWLEKVLKDSRRHLYVIEDLAGRTIGTVRFDEEGKMAEINIIIAKEFRCKGYGTQSIWQASRFFLASHPQINQIIARIKEANEASIRSFAKAGFKEHKKDEGIIYLAIDRL